MIKRGVESIAGTWLAGLLVLLPLALTLAALAWALSLVNRLLGPGSLVGLAFAALGYPFSRNPALQYVFGTLVLIAGVYLLGILVQSGLRGPVHTLIARSLRRVPILGAVYSLADRFVGLLDRKPDTDLAALRPVWCLFGGNGVAVLALAPSAEPIDIDGRITAPPSPDQGTTVFPGRAPGRP